jgi:N-formylglutamate amidohydrolase
MIVPGVLTLTAPAGEPRPILFDSPHSGRQYPDDFGSSLPMEILRRGEDAYVDELLSAAPKHGIALLAALFPRSYIDPNRREGDLDPVLIDGQWPHGLQPSDKVKLGIGLIRRVVVPGAEIYDRKLSVAEIEGRIRRYHRPYLAALDQAFEDLHRRYGRLWHINWHSMKSRGNAATPDGDDARRPDFVIGDRQGTSCAPRLTRKVADTLTRLGYAVSVNEPYAGGALVQRLGDPARGLHSLQIEISRALYLDEVRVAKTHGFDVLSDNLETLMLELIRDHW